MTLLFAGDVRERCALQGIKGQGLWWLRVEGEPGLAEDPVDEAVLVGFVASPGGAGVAGACFGSHRSQAVAEESVAWLEVPAVPW